MCAWRGGTLWPDSSEKAVPESLEALVSGNGLAPELRGEVGLWPPGEFMESRRSSASLRKGVVLAFSLQSKWTNC